MKEPGQEQPPSPAPRQQKTGAAKRRWRLLARCLAGLAFVGVFLHWILPLFYPLPDGLESWSPPGIVVRDCNNRPIAHLPSPDHYRGSHTPLDQLPQDFINATLSAEDKRFYRHGGIDYVALVRAAFSQVHSTGLKSGASTVSQQLVKLSSPPRTRDIFAKFHECMTARHLEMTHGKSFILSAYFDRLDYGNLRIGPSAASEYYFGKPLDELSLGQMALLAALPQSPTRLNPYKNPQRAILRRNWILSRLKDEFNYPADRIERAMLEKLTLADRSKMPALAPHLTSKIMASGMARGEVRTTLDAELQEFCNESVRSALARLSGKQVTQAAVVVIHNPTGNILAWVGSSNRNHPVGGLLDGVLIPRSAGSTLKPFVYAVGFERGHWAGEILADVPITFRKIDGYDAPGNYNNAYRGPITAREALACSQNIPAMNMLLASGGARLLIEKLKQFGFTTLDKDARHYGLGLAIGNAEVKLLELANAYAMLARRGILKPAQWENPQSPQNQEQAAARQKETRVLREDVCFVIGDILSDNLARTAAFGADSPLAFKFPCAAKTGTSSDFHDNWCVGYTKDITVGVWVGNFNFTPMKNISGVTGAGPIFHAVMEKAHGKYPSKFDPPGENLVKVFIDKRNGLLQAPDGIPGNCGYEEWAFKSRQPRQAGEKDYDKQGRALLDNRYAEWYRSKDNTAASLYALEPSMWSGETPKITSPPDQSTLVIDPELPDGGRFINLKCNLPENVEWSCETLAITTRNGRQVAELVPGRHTITARNKELNLECKAEIRVKQL